MKILLKGINTKILIFDLFDEVCFKILLTVGETLKRVLHFPTNLKRNSLISSCEAENIKNCLKDQTN